MFIHRRKIRLQDTDATGVLYFPRQFEMALETFEEFLAHHRMPLSSVINSSYLLPVVHAEASYTAPVRVGDAIDIELAIEKIGTKSFTLAYRFFKEGAVVGTAKIIHVALDRKTHQSVPIPPFLHTILQS